MKKIILGLMLTGVILSGCSAKISTTKTAEEKLQENVVTKEGSILTMSGGEYLLSTKDGVVSIVSNKVDLSNYAKKKIKVTGMFSGSTLYVDKIETSN